jgi:predicted nucleic acid-binding Zn ribbon protein
LSKNNKYNFTHISNILDTTLKNYRPKSDMEMTRIWDTWTDAVGNEVAKNAKPAAFKDGVLIVNVSSSVWIQHLKFLENDMITNINQILNKRLVRKVRFKIAKLHN